MIVLPFVSLISRRPSVRTVLIVVISAVLGAVLASGILAYRSPVDPSSPQPQGLVDARFIPLGQAYLPELGGVYAAAWNQGAKGLDAGEPAATALQDVARAWDAGRIQLFDRLVGPEFSKVLPEGQSETDPSAPGQKAALARAWRGFAAGLKAHKQK
jgi:hypothetical protein